LRTERAKGELKMGQPAGTGSKGRAPPNPNNGSGNALDNSNGVANQSQASGTVLNGTPPQTTSTNPAQTTSMTGNAALATPATPASGQASATAMPGKPTASGSKGGPQPPPAQSTYAATMQAALNGTPATPPGSTNTTGMPAPAGSMQASLTPPTRGGERSGMPLVQDTGAAQPSMMSSLQSMFQNPGQAGGVGAIMDAVGKGQTKGGQPPGPQGLAQQGAAQAQKGQGAGVAPEATPAKNFTDGFATTQGNAFMPPATDWSKVDPNVQRTNDGKAQVLDQTPMFTAAAGSIADKAMNFQFKDPTEPWQKNWNALPPNMRIQYASSGNGYEGNTNQGMELLAHALQEDGGMTKQQTDQIRGMVLGGADSFKPKQNAGITTNDAVTGMGGLSGGTVRLEGNTLYRTGPNGQKIIMARLPYAQTMTRAPNGAWSADPNSYVGKTHAKITAREEAIRQAGGNPNEAFTPNPPPSAATTTTTTPPPVTTSAPRTTRPRGS
jgi:hypothetical protein